jgi:hypothetical protein
MVCVRLWSEADSAFSLECGCSLGIKIGSVSDYGLKMTVL